MTKPQPYWAAFKQPARSMKNHGKHRRAGAPAHGHSIVGASPSAGGADAFTSIWQSWNTVTVITGADFAEPEPPQPPTLPYAGVRTGEIVGHRLWWIIPHFGGYRLSSLAHLRLWEPGETIHGNIEENVSKGFFGRVRPIWGGTYAFAARDDLQKEFEVISHFIRERNKRRGAGWFFVSAFHDDPEEKAVGAVVGTIKMWGDVVEHKTGWRSQFAKINSIDEIVGEGDIAALRQRYGV